MKRWSSRQLLGAAAAVACLLSLSGAGVMRLLRTSVEQAIVDTDARRAPLQRQLERSREELAAIVPAAAAPQPFVPQDVATSMQVVHELAAARAVTLDKVHAAAAAGAGKQVIEVIGRGAPAAVCDLLAAVENERRLLIVAAGSFGAGLEGQVMFELDLVVPPGGER